MVGPFASGMDTLPRKGHSALGLGFRKDVMLRLYHAFLGLRNRPQPLTGKGCLLHKQKNPHRTADGTLRVRITTAGGLSPRHRASREMHVRRTRLSFLQVKSAA